MFCEVSELPLLVSCPKFNFRKTKNTFYAELFYQGKLKNRQAEWACCDFMEAGKENRDFSHLLDFDFY